MPWCDNWQASMVPPWYAPTYLPYVDTTHRKSKQHPTNRGCNLTVTSRWGLYWPGYGWSSAWLNCLILWNLSYPKGRLVEQVTLLSSSILVTIWFGHSSSHNIGITIYEAKVTSIEDRLKVSRFYMSRWCGSGGQQSDSSSTSFIYLLAREK